MQGFEYLPEINSLSYFFSIFLPTQLEEEETGRRKMIGSSGGFFWKVFGLLAVVAPLMNEGIIVIKH